MNAMKIFIIVLVLIGVLAMCGMGASFMGGDDTNNGTPEPWVDALGDVVAQPRALRLDELQQQNSNCRVQDPLRVETTCTYTIAKSEDLLGTTRRLALRLTQGDEATIELRQKDYVTSKATLTPSERDVDLDVYKEKDEVPAELTILCSSPPVCAFTLRE